MLCCDVYLSKKMKLSIVTAPFCFSGQSSRKLKLTYPSNNTKFNLNYWSYHYTKLHNDVFLDAQYYIFSKFGHIENFSVTVRLSIVGTSDLRVILRSLKIFFPCDIIKTSLK